MSKYQGVFKRFEKKYLLSSAQYQALIGRLADQMKMDRYGKTAILNVYFDTPDHRIIRRSIEKPPYKEKLRLRSYGVPQEDDRVFVELKKKYDGIVYKRRVGMSLKGAEQYLYDREEPEKPCQITNEISWFLREYPGLVPAMVISYDRTAFSGIEDKNLRVTFDSNLLWRDQDLFLEKGAFGTALLEPGQRLMEIKIPGAMPVWLAHALDELRIYPVSFSKYGRAYGMAVKHLFDEKARGYSA